MTPPLTHPPPARRPPLPPPQLGNFLNWGSRLGAAAGFRLKSLRKLQVGARAGSHSCRRGGRLCTAAWLWSAPPGRLAKKLRSVCCTPVCCTPGCYQTQAGCHQPLPAPAAAQDTRSLDGKTNLLSWLAGQLSGAEPPAPLLAAQLPHVVSPRLRVSCQEVADALAAVEAAAAGVEEELRRCGPPVSVGLAVVEPAAAAAAAAGDGGSGGGGSSGGVERVALSLTLDSFQEVMGAALASVRSELVAAQRLLGAVRESFATLAAHFGESAAALGSEQELWADLAEFVKAFSGAQEAALRALRAAQREGEKQAAAARPGPAPRRRPTNAALPPAGATDAVATVANGLAGAKKQLSFCSSSAVSSDGTALQDQQRRVEELLRDEASEA